MSKITFNINAPEFVPSSCVDNHTAPNTNKKHNKNRKYRNHSKKINPDGELWGPIKGWLPFYRCQVCHTIMSKKEPSKSPQKIYVCGHVTCARCIVNSYLVDLNPTCPVNKCGKHVNPHDIFSAPRLAILSGEPVSEPLSEPVSEPLSEPPNEPTTEFITDIDPEPTTESEDTIDNNNNNVPENKQTNIHHCGDEYCEWDCGELWCGCIDVCRGRCGFRDYDRW
jgi:hypothetical protein